MADALQRSAVANVLANDPRFGPLATLTERLERLDLSVLLVYLIDLVGADLLPLLAEQFHVMGDEGWLLANTDEQRRELIRRAIELHRYKGTVWAVKEVLHVLNVDVELLEWWQQQPAATPYTFALTAWVNDNLLPGKPVLSAELYERLRRMVEMVKPARAGFAFKVGSRFDQPLQLASASQGAAVGRWNVESQAVQPTPAIQPLRAANAQHTHAVTRTSAAPTAVQPTAATTPIRLASAARPLSVIRVTMEAQ